MVIWCKIHQLSLMLACHVNWIRFGNSISEPVWSHHNGATNSMYTVANRYATRHYSAPQKLWDWDEAHLYFMVLFVSSDRIWSALKPEVGWTGFRFDQLSIRAQFSVENIPLRLVRFEQKNKLFLWDWFSSYLLNNQELVKRENLAHKKHFHCPTGEGLDQFWQSGLSFKGTIIGHY